MPDQSFPVYLSTHAASVAHHDPNCVSLRNRPEFYGGPEKRRAVIAGRLNEVALLTLNGRTQARLLRKCSKCWPPS